MNFLKNKKAQQHNYLAVIIALMLFGFFSILAYTVWTYFIAAFNASGLASASTDLAIQNFTRAFQTADYLIVLLMAAFIIGIGVTSYKLPTRTIGFIVTLIIAIFWGFISYFFNYVFIQMVSPSVFSATIGVFPRTMILCTNLHWVMLLEIIVGSITLYGKKEQGQYLS